MLSSVDSNHTVDNKKKRNERNGLEQVYTGIQFLNCIFQGIVCCEPIGIQDFVQELFIVEKLTVSA